MNFSTDPPTWPETIAKTVVAAVPFVGSSLIVLWDDVKARRAAAALEMVEVVLATIRQDALAERLEQDPVFEALFVGALDSGIRTGIAAKRKLLARVVAQAAEDDAKVDESWLIMDALSKLEAPHLHVLALVDAEYRDGTEDNLRWGFSPAFRRAPAPVRGALGSTGAVRSEPGSVLTRQATPTKVITDFGEQLLRDLRTEGLDDELSSRLGRGEQ